MERVSVCAINITWQDNNSIELNSWFRGLSHRSAQVFHATFNNGHDLTTGRATQSSRHVPVHPCDSSIEDQKMVHSFL